MSSLRQKIVTPKKNTTTSSTSAPSYATARKRAKKTSSDSSESRVDNNNNDADNNNDIGSDNDVSNDNDTNNNIEDEVELDTPNLLEGSNMEEPSKPSLKRKVSYNSSFKQMIIDAYKDLFNVNLNPSMDEADLYAELVIASSEGYDDEADLESRFKYLQKQFSSVLQFRDAPFQNMPAIKTEGYKLLFDRINMIKNTVDSVRSSTEFSLTNILEALELSSILSQFCLMSIKMGIEENFKAAKKFCDKFESGGSIYDITSKTREKCIKKANAELDREEVKKGRNYRPKFQSRGVGRRPFFNRQQPRFEQDNRYSNKPRFEQDDNRRERRFTLDNSSNYNRGGDGNSTNSHK